MIPSFILKVAVPIFTFVVLRVYDRLSHRLSGCVPNGSHCTVISRIWGHKLAFISAVASISAMELCDASSIGPTEPFRSYAIFARFALYFSLASIVVYLGMMDRIRLLIDNDYPVDRIRIRGRVAFINLVGSLWYLISVFLLTGALYASN